VFASLSKTDPSKTAHFTPSEIGRTQRWQCDLCPRSYSTSGNLTRSQLPTHLPCLALSGLAWPGLVCSGLVWCGVAMVERRLYAYRHHKSVHGVADADEKGDHDGEEQATDDKINPPKRQKQQSTGSSSPFTCDEQREVGQHCMHSKWGKCTLVAEAMGGWNVLYASEATGARLYYASNGELSAI
jgi:hypothetical protein